MHTTRILAAVASALLIAACGGDEDAVPDANARPANASAPNGGEARGPATKAADRSRTPGRTAPSITLAASDVARVGRDMIEEGIAVTGDLRPIETVDVRARLEGDLVGVFVREGQRVRAGELLARFESSEQESGFASAEADRVAARIGAVDRAVEPGADDRAPSRRVRSSERDLKTAQQARHRRACAARGRAGARSRDAAPWCATRASLAPTTGVIAQRLVENGEHVARGAGLFTLVRSDVLELAAAVPARQASAVRVGQVVHFVADGRSFDGKVARVSPTIDPTTRSVTVYVQIPNASGSLKGGTFATGRVVSRVVHRRARRADGGGAPVAPTTASPSCIASPAR